MLLMSAGGFGHHRGRTLVRRSLHDAAASSIDILKMIRHQQPPAAASAAANNTLAKFRYWCIVFFFFLKKGICKTMNFMDTPAKNVDFSGKFHHSLRSVRNTHLLILEKKKCKERDDYLPNYEKV